LHPLTPDEKANLEAELAKKAKKRAKKEAAVKEA